MCISCLCKLLTQHPPQSPSSLRGIPQSLQVVFLCLEGLLCPLLWGSEPGCIIPKGHCGVRAQGHCQGSGQQDPLQLALLTSFLFTGAAMGKARPQAGCAMPVLAQCIPALLLGQVLQVGSESGAFPPLDLKSGGCLLPWIPACSLSGLSRSPNNLPRLHVTFINKLLCHLFMYSC